ncbi:MAG TPA: endonuclease domain-containing protein [Nitrososphaera sp.]|nr:endonuclease domain-containing protein [Nitrososphaera sp.]
MTIADVDQMRKKQNNTCALCRAQLGVAHKFDVPSRGKLRGILCKQCSEKVDGMSAEDAKVILGSTKEKSLVRLASYVLGV